MLFQTSFNATKIKPYIEYINTGSIHRALLPVIPAPYTSCPKWNIKLLKTTKNGGNKSNKVVLFFLWGHIKIMWKLQSCRIISLAVISKRVMGGFVNSDWINAEVWIGVPKNCNKPFWNQVRPLGAFSANFSTRTINPLRLLCHCGHSSRGLNSGDTTLSTWAY